VPGDCDPTSGAATPTEGRATIQAATPEQGAEILRPYIDAGFAGFIFNYSTLPTPESVAVRAK
jgi:alkanesulfonate monooxygenase SsuD/methylene tetrahydromethanopterin reductase-like flavin-dependent oxidoreductase (luciferase family)